MRKITIDPLKDRGRRNAKSFATRKGWRAGASPVSWRP
jgi:hypothetical protein